MGRVDLRPGTQHDKLSIVTKVEEGHNPRFFINGVEVFGIVSIEYNNDYQDYGMGDMYPMKRMLTSRRVTIELYNPEVTTYQV